MRVDFYILPENMRVEIFLCRLLNKIFPQIESAFVLCEDEAQAKKIDDVLWTFEDISFVPHSLANDSASKAPIQIGTLTQIQKEPLILNLTEANLENHFQRVLEFVPYKPIYRQKAREKYKYYQSLRCEIHNHSITL